VSLHNEQNPIRKWMEHCRSNADPLLDDGDTESDTLIPSRIVMQCDDSRTLRRITDKISIVDWVDETARDTHIGKRNKRPLQRRAKEKNPKRVLGSDESTPSPGRSPPYQESNDNTYVTDDDGGGDGASGYCITPSGGGTQFTSEKHKLCYICLL
jgi:hypothetical protein